jgi:hypothetical protein
MRNVFTLLLTIGMLIFVLATSTRFFRDYLTVSPQVQRITVIVVVALVLLWFVSCCHTCKR